MCGRFHEGNHEGCVCCVSCDHCNVILFYRGQTKILSISLSASLPAVFSSPQLLFCAWIYNVFYFSVCSYGYGWLSGIIIKNIKFYNNTVTQKRKLF